MMCSSDRKRALHSDKRSREGAGGQARGGYCGVAETLPVGKLNPRGKRRSQGGLASLEG